MEDKIEQNLEGKEIDLQVGDRITYKYMNNGDELIHIAIIYSDSDLFDYKERIESKTQIGSIEILKIERPEYKVIEEKKELLTEEEKEFLKEICKYYYDISKIYFSSEDTILFCNETFFVICKFNFYPKNMEFKKIERNKDYTLKELGLEE